MLIKVDTYTFNSFVSGYHAYMNIWNPQIGNNDVKMN